MTAIDDLLSEVDATLAEAGVAKDEADEAGETDLEVGPEEFFDWCAAHVSALKEEDDGGRALAIYLRDEVLPLHKNYESKEQVRLPPPPKRNKQATDAYKARSERRVAMRTGMPTSVSMGFADIGKAAARIHEALSAFLGPEVPATKGEPEKAKPFAWPSEINGHPDRLADLRFKR